MSNPPALLSPFEESACIAENILGGDAPRSHEEAHIIRLIANALRERAARDDATTPIRPPP